jgi:hypothetical protein
MSTYETNAKYIRLMASRVPDYSFPNPLSKLQTLDCIVFLSVNRLQSYLVSLSFLLENCYN